MNILIFNWRDIKNPAAGGSERYFHEISKKLISEGNSVSWICGGWEGCKKQEVIDGIKITRIGGLFTQYLLAPFAYFKLKEKPDIIIDVENGIPFFTPLFSKSKVILHIHHIHRDIWFRELPFFPALAGHILETKIMPLVYRKNKVITLSKSSAEDIKKEKIGKILGIVNPGIELGKYKKFGKNKNPAVLFLNRIKKYKGADIFLDAAAILSKNVKNLQVWVAGSGFELEKIKKYAKSKKMENVTFFGRISEEKKSELMQKAWVFVNSSFKEGWGIVNIEANYYGTPVIGSNVSGIKDSVVDGKTGLLFKYNDVQDLAGKMGLLIKNSRLRNQMGKNGRKWASKFSWDAKAKEYADLLRR